MPARSLLLLTLVLATGCGSDAHLEATGGRAGEGHRPGDCSDGADNDGDGAFDCADPGCASDPDCTDDPADGPTAPTVAISPAAPTSADDLRCEITQDSESPDGAAVTYEIRWSRDGSTIAIDTEVLSARETLRGEWWTCSVTPYAAGMSGREGTASVAIGNTPPGSPSVAIRPGAPLEGVDDLVCEALNAPTDPDDDPLVSVVSWLMDGSEAPYGETSVISGDTQPAERTRAGQTWTCVMTIEDGEGGIAESTAEVVVLSCDGDLDGHDAVACGGDDCDDTRSDVNPDMSEVCNNGIDDDCDGSPDPCTLNGEIRRSDAVALRWGEGPYDYAGTASSGGIDLDGDAREDWLTGAYAYSGVAANCGIAWVLAGPVSGSTSLSSATARIEGDVPGGFMGHTVDLTDDLTGDGSPDVVVGASGVDFGSRDEGAVYIYAGPVTGSHTAASATAWIPGVEQDGRIGSAVAEAVAVDSAGTAGLLLGAYGLSAGGTERGGAYLLSGPFTAEIDLAGAVATFHGQADSDHAGKHVAAGDLDGDGLSDLVLGADNHDGGGLNAGVVYVVNGPVSGHRDLADADEILYGEQPGDNAGAAVESVGDINADGRADVMVGARHADLSGSGALQGKAYLLLGPVSATDLYAAHAELRGESGSDRTGASLGIAGDVDGDGFDDMLVGAIDNGTNGEHAGAAFLVYGPVTGQVSMGAADARIRGERGDYLGNGLAGSDQDGDGYADIMVGMFYDSTAAPSAGAVAVFSGGGL